MKANGYPDLERPQQISEADFSAISDFIIATLKEHDSITLFDLLDAARAGLAGRIRGDFAWSVLLVKNFLEFRRVISTSKNSRDYCKPRITLTRAYRNRRVRFLAEVEE